MNYCVTADGNDIPIKTAKVYPSPYHKTSTMEYIQFFIDAPVCLKICSKKKVDHVTVRPLHLGLKAEIQNGDIILQLEEPVKCSLEINHSCEENLLIIAEKSQKEDILETSEHLICFPAGIHRPDIITVSQNNTIVYLEEGAYLHGKLNIVECGHVKVCGFGVISMEQYDVTTRPIHACCIDVTHSYDIEIRDITIMDSNDWSVRIRGCEDVTVDNVKIFGCRGNSDGVDVCGSRRVLVQNVFTRVWDDSLVVKALDTGDTEDVRFQNCIVWNDFARPMEIGVELRADNVRKIRFENIDVIHSPTGYPLMGIHHGDRAHVSDIVFENIRIEDAPGAQLFDVRIVPSFWNRDKKMGTIRNVLFRNINVIGNPGIPLLLSESRIEGYSQEHNICGIYFQNVTICGKTAGDIRALGLKCKDYTEHILVEPDPDMEPIQMIETALTIAEPFVLQSDGIYEGTVKVTFTNPYQDEKEKEIWLKISPEHMGEFDRARKKVHINPECQTELNYRIRLQPGKYMIALQSDDPEIAYVWKLIQLDWILDRNISHGMEIVNFWGDRLGRIRAKAELGFLTLESPLFFRDDCVVAVYTADPVPRREGEVVFSVEETDFGQVPAVVEGRHGLETAPQLRCPLEITLVFKNEPKVKKIHCLKLEHIGAGRVEIPLEQLGLVRSTLHFWMEIEVQLPELDKYRYPYTLFHSVSPCTTAHMFGNCRIVEN